MDDLWIRTISVHHRNIRENSIFRLISQFRKADIHFKLAVLRGGSEPPFNRNRIKALPVVLIPQLVLYTSMLSICHLKPHFDCLLEKTYPRNKKNYTSIIICFLVNGPMKRIKIFIALKECHQALEPTRSYLQKSDNEMISIRTCVVCF